MFFELFDMRATSSFRETSDASGASSDQAQSDAAAIARAAARWQRFAASLSEVDTIVLDKAAIGQKLKVVCFDHNVPYDTLQKRFKRWQEELGLPSLNVLLYMWQVVRNHQPRSASGATDITNATTLAQTHLHASDVPTLMRYASEVALEVAMQARPGYTEVSLPDSLRARSRGVHALCGEPRRRADITEHMAECVMSPALWLAVLTIGQQVGASGLQRSVVPFQHQLFLQMLGSADSADSHANSNAHAATQFCEALQGDEIKGASHWGEGAPLALPLAITARAMGLLKDVPPTAAETELRRSPPMQQRAFWESRAARIDYAAYVTRNDIALWQRFSAGIRDDQTVANALHAVTLDIVLAPLTGMAVAIVARSARFAAIRDQFTLMYQVILRARLRHAQHLGMHPRRMLAYFALQEVGIPIHASTMQLGVDESILTEVDFSGPVTEAALRRVERRVRAAEVAAQPLLPLAELLRAT